MLFAKSYEREGFFAYHTMVEVFAHWAIKIVDKKARLIFGDSHE